MARVWEQRAPSEARQQATAALMDAAEDLLYEVGYAGVSLLLRLGILSVVETLPEGRVRISAEKRAAAIVK